MLFRSDTRSLLGKQQIASLDSRSRLELFEFKFFHLPMEASVKAEGEASSFDPDATFAPPPSRLNIREVTREAPATFRSSQNQDVVSHKLFVEQIPVTQVDQATVAFRHEQPSQPPQASPVIRAPQVVQSSFSVQTPSSEGQALSTGRSQTIDLPSSAFVRTAIQAPLGSLTTAKGNTDYISLESRSSLKLFQTNSIEPFVAPTPFKDTRSDHPSSEIKNRAKLPVEDGMLRFAMKVPFAFETAGSTDPKNSRTWSRDNQAWDDSKKSTVRSNRGEVITISSRLPLPKGMIEVKDRPEDLKQRSLSSKTSSNPFEILQLFIGSTNDEPTKISQSQGDRTRDVDSAIASWNEPLEEGEPTTREDLLVALGIGAAFAVAIRESATQRSAKLFHSVLGRRSEQTS